jgi:hypothetical protein
MGRNGGKWTEGRFKAFIISILRAGTRRWQPKYETLQDAFVGQRINPKSKRLSKHYKCAACEGEFPTAQVQVDHRRPVVSVDDGFTTWDSFIESLYCEKDNLQVLCIPCHNIKTKEERLASKQRTTT